MPLTKEKKQEVIAEASQLLADSKLTVIAKYSGTTVKAMQALRRDAKASGTSVKVYKNRLVKKALESTPAFKDADASVLTGQLLYAFNADDEVAPAQALADFAKTSPTLEFMGAFTAEGSFMPAEDVKALASLPSKDQLRAQLVGMFSAPSRNLVSVLAGSNRAVLNVLAARGLSLES